MDYFFVGYDPGLTTAVALVDLEGNLVAVKSGREMKDSELIGFIGAFGKPIFVCADKVPVPAAVEKLAAIFETGVFAPGQPLSVDEKKALCSELSLDNAHERDAAAAALNAYNFHLNKIRNLRKRLSEEQIAMALQGVWVGQKKEEGPEKQAQPRRTDVPALLMQLKIIEEDRRHLRETIRNLEERLAACEVRKTPAKREEKSADKASEEKDARIRELKRTVVGVEAALSEERKNKRTAIRYYGLALENKKPVKILEELSERAVLELEKSIGIARNDVILCKKPGGKRPAEMLAERGVSAIIVRGLPEGVETILEERKIAIYDPEEVKIVSANGIPIVEKYEKKADAELERLIKSYRESRGGARTD